ncbi:MAG: sigma-54-dependent Fis family transcriptional regulator [Bdellovibrionales bacterium]|nr:sigma-54-dependent Fis family transcriptional regulator [Bdellovibrionales bacterium]
MPALAPAPKSSSRASAHFIPGEKVPSPHPEVPGRATAGDIRESWFWGKGKFSMDLLQSLQLAASNDLNVLIVGETGTGKELVARHLHQIRRRRKGLTDTEAPFTTVNCAAIPEALAESILFGHERGAFTSARDRQLGKFELARRGTLFLDEIQSLSLTTQSKLLRVLQHRQFERLGAQRAQSVECQIVTASNVPLEILLDRKTFRRDLFYRLNICPLYLHSLRARRDEFEVIVPALLQRLCKEHRLGDRSLSPEAFRCLQAYDWPGNFRQLEHALIFAALRSKTVIELAHLPNFLTGQLKRYLEEGVWDV